MDEAWGWVRSPVCRLNIKRACPFGSLRARQSSCPNCQTVYHAWGLQQGSPHYVYNFDASGTRVQHNLEVQVLAGSLAGSALISDSTTAQGAVTAVRIFGGHGVDRTYKTSRNRLDLIVPMLVFQHFWPQRTWLRPARRPLASWIRPYGFWWTARWLEPGAISSACRLTRSTINPTFATNRSVRETQSRVSQRFDCAIARNVPQQSADRPGGRRATVSDCASGKLCRRSARQYHGRPASGS
jgi:hypothetical protein